jgi:hypothetical protein
VFVRALGSERVVGYNLRPNFVVFCKDEGVFVKALGSDSVGSHISETRF